MKIVKLVKYQLKVYFRGAGFVMPFIATAIFLYMMYCQKPIDVISGFLITGVFLFYIMLWIGISVAQQENNEVEQIVIFKINSYPIYCIGKSLFLVVIALIFTGICILFPIIENLINSNELFERSLVISDIVGSMLIISASAICGVLLGNLFHPQIIKDKKMSYGALTFIGVLVVAKEALIHKWMFLKYFLWVFPSIMLPAKRFADVKYFSVGQSFEIFITQILFAVASGTIKGILCYKNKF